MLASLSRRCGALLATQRVAAAAAAQAPAVAAVATREAGSALRVALAARRPLGCAAPLQAAAFSSKASKLGPINDGITAKSVQLVGDDGKIRRNVPLHQALAEAKSQGVDLVQVAENNGQVVCRLFDAKKRLFNLKKAAKNNKPKQDKEVVFGVKIEAHDVRVKAEHVRKFLSKGHKVKVTVRFGKELHLKPKALDQLALIEEAIGSEVGVPDHAPQDQYGGIYVHYAPRSLK
ncbi:hypothetical protein P43SY_003680 [Pythium insidiosum]|uniref:Translation initiation factor IF-3 n=1 Tax=Pythium insidiosum TaxID=114742 RepID=A0AAD5Q6X7_PYTIN|nr:hypothetical protein P43SY_003680 [Pythium insidiosum]